MPSLEKPGKVDHAPVVNLMCNAEEGESDNLHSHTCFSTITSFSVTKSGPLANTEHLVNDISDSVDEPSEDKHYNLTTHIVRLYGHSFESTNKAVGDVAGKK